ncbi:MAG: hypothetical protein OXT09_27285, partial [Myxococcales bacterium]|nr:hypothetical protein [Myxococcales bacterium]
ACTGDEHCLVGARQRCSEDNECVECLNDGHCTAETADFCIANSCEQCRDDDDCSAAAGTPLCDDATKTCIAECTSHGDCTDPTKAQCDSGNCVACDADAQCEGVQRDGKGAEVCDDGECWECTVQNETACEERVCVPATKVCSPDRLKADKSICEGCIADSECVALHRCVPMEFDGAQRESAYCLRIGAQGCSAPYLATPIVRQSVSGADAEEYCGINEADVSCEAVRALVAGDSCPGGVDQECAGDGGLCRTVNLGANLCTYACGSTLECPGFVCGSGYCGGPE